MFKNQSTIFLSRLIFNQVNFPLKVYIKIVLRTAVKKIALGNLVGGLPCTRIQQMAGDNGIRKHCSNGIKQSMHVVVKAILEVLRRLDMF